MDNHRLSIEEQLAVYTESQEFQDDISYLQNEYWLNGGQKPSEKELRMEAIICKRQQLESLVICDNEGHQFVETADAENGTSDLDCQRCGLSYHMIW